MLRYWTAGESHGPALVALVDGFPAGLTVDKGAIDHELKRRQGGYGRGGPNTGEIPRGLPVAHRLAPGGGGLSGRRGREGDSGPTMP